MKKRILFVDDEVKILRGTKRMLRPFREQWEMGFVQGAENALKVLEKKTYEVIVSDMRMPEMDGAQLLQIVKEKYPKMVRIILSGHSDQELIMKSVKSAHQYLSKPCEKQQLLTAITRSISLRKLMGQPVLLDLLGGIETMPSLPSLYTRVMEELQSSSASASSVGKIISEDMGMTAKVLQLVNSSFFGTAGHISNVRDAVVMLGIDIVKTLVLGIEVFSKASSSALSVISIDQMQAHSTETGAIAKSIATVEKMGRENIDYATISGILHDLGKLLFLEYFPDQYKDVIAAVQADKISYYQAEMKIFGVSHAQTGAYLLGLWGFPDPVVEAVALHHYPCGNTSDTFDLCGVIHLADLMEYHERSQPGTWEQLGGADETYLQTHHLRDRVMLWRDSIQSDKS